MTSNLDSLKALVKDPFPQEEYPRAWDLFDEEEYFYYTTNKVATLEHFITDPKCKSVSLGNLDGFNFSLLLTARNGAVLFSNKALYIGTPDKKRIVELLGEYPLNYTPRPLIESVAKEYLL